MCNHDQYYSKHNLARKKDAGHERARVETPQRQRVFDRHFHPIAIAKHA